MISRQKSDGVFSFNSISLAEEMQMIQQLRLDDPAAAFKKANIGEELVRLAGLGELRSIFKLIENLEKGDLMFYFSVKMFRAALMSSHIIIAEFMIRQGYPLTSSPGVPNVLLSCLMECDDTNSMAIVHFLSEKNFDINTPCDKTWETALHISLRRGLLKTAEALIDHGIDINAIAKDDVMPLTLAHSLPASNDRDGIIKKLIDRGARSSWKRNTGNREMRDITSFHTGGEESTLISCKSTMPSSLTQPPTGVIFKRFTYGRTEQIRAGDSLAVEALPTVSRAMEFESSVTKEFGNVSVSDDGGLMFSTSSK